jgi:hypothetical protein
VLDGLDECDEETLKVLVPKIVDLFSLENSQHTTKAFKLVIVSRDIPNLRGCAQVKLDFDNDEQVANDVELFTSAKARELSRIKGLNEELHAIVKETLLKHSEGTFLWVSSIVSKLFQKTTDSEVRVALRSLPKALHAIYGRILLQIESRYRHTSSITLRSLQWPFAL